MKSINKFFPKSKTLPLDKFVGNAMYDKKNGYYSKKISFGKNGDFITSPGISSLFSEMLALWIISFWEHLEKPKIFNIGVLITPTAIPIGADKKPDKRPKITL